MRAQAAFEAAALLSGVPRKFVTRYLNAVAAAREATEFWSGAGPDERGDWVLLNGLESGEHRAAVEALSRILWYPWLGRLPAWTSKA